MSRIEEALRNASGSGERGFIPFITACDPDPKTSVELILALADVGATVVELGVPFTDPMADGPVIQKSSQRALATGDAGVMTILGIVSEVRNRSDVPVVLFGYMNPFLAYGIERLCADAVGAGVDGFLVTDVIEDEFSRLSRQMAASELDLISLVAPTTSDERLGTIAREARGFIYAVSRTGVTGEGSEIRDSARELVRRVRKVSGLPVAVGFGISDREQFEDVLEYADAAVVGSAIVRVIEDHGPSGNAVSALKDFASRLTGRPDRSEVNGRGIAL